MSIESLQLDVLAKIFGEFDITDARNFRLTSMKFAQASKHNAATYKRYRKMLKSLALCNCRAYKFIKLYTTEIILSMLYDNIANAKYIKCCPNMLLEILRHKSITGCFLQYMTITDEKLMEKIIKIKSCAIIYLHNPPIELCKIALDKNPSLIEYPQLRDRKDGNKIIKYAIQRDWSVIKHINCTYKNIKFALDTFYKNNTIKITMNHRILDISENVLQTCKRYNRSSDMIEYAIQKQPINIIYAEQEYIRNNLHRLKSVIKDQPMAIGLSLLKEYLNSELYLTAVKYDPMSLCFVPPAEQTEEMCLMAVQKDPYALKYVSVYTLPILDAARQHFLI